MDHLGIILISMFAGVLGHIVWDFLKHRRNWMPYYWECNRCEDGNVFSFETNSRDAYKTVMEGHLRDHEGR